MTSMYNDRNNDDGHRMVVGDFSTMGIFKLSSERCCVAKVVEHAWKDASRRGSTCSKAELFLINWETKTYRVEWLRERGKDEVVETGRILTYAGLTGLFTKGLKDSSFHIKHNNRLEGIRFIHYSYIYLFYFWWVFDHVRLSNCVRSLHLSS